MASAATGAHIIVVRQVDVKHKFSLLWVEAACSMGPR